jgi:hypothetical protein
MITEYDLRRATQEDIVIDEFTRKLLLKRLEPISLEFGIQTPTKHNIDVLIGLLENVKNKPLEILDTIRILQNYLHDKAGYNHATPKKAVDELIEYLEVK